MQGGTMQQVNGRLAHPYDQQVNCHDLSSQNARHVVEQAVAAAFRVPCRELRARTRRKASVAFARQVAMCLAHVACGLTLTEVGELFGRDRTTVAHACGIVEDRRDDPLFDLFLDHLEIAVVRLGNALSAMESQR